MRAMLTVAGFGWAAVAAAQPAESPRELFEAARTAQARGDPSAALDAAERAAKLAPDDPEILRLLGVLQGQAGRTEDAARTLARARQLAPGDSDIWLAIARNHYYRGENNTAAAVAAEIVEAQPGNAEARELLESARRAARSRSPSADGPQWRIDASVGYSDFDDDVRKRWLETGVALGYRFDANTGFHGRADVSDRFGTTDVYGEVGIDRRFSNGMAVNLAVGATPGASFLPRWVLQGGVRAPVVRTIFGDSVLTLDGRYAEYRTGGVETLSPGLEHYLLAGRLWLTGRMFFTRDENDDRQTGYLLRSDAQVTERLRIFVGYADAPETSENVTLTTETIFGGAVIDVGDRFTLRLDFARDDRERSYIRNAFALGVGVRF